MYIIIKLPPAFGSFNRLREENYPFNKLFTAYLAAVSRLGMALSMDVEELVGYIEDRVFDGERLPDIPDGDEPVNMRYKTSDPDITAYIGESSLTNRMAVMYIARMTLRLSAAYGTSLFRLTRVINDLAAEKEGHSIKPKKQAQEQKTQAPAKPKPKSAPKKEEPAAEDIPEEKEEKKEEAPLPTFHVTRKSSVQEDSGKASGQTEPPKVSDSVTKAKAALSELTGLTAQAAAQDSEDVIEANPYLKNFFST